jgi:S1-C subfamily serine protease
LRIVLSILRYVFFYPALICVLASCAIHRQAQPVQAVADGLSKEFSTGTVRLECQTSCALSWRLKSRHAKTLYDNKLWTDLAAQVLEINYPSDLTYYYLGRAAEGMKQHEAASIYYRLALTELHRCDGWMNDCDGFDFPKDIRVRMSGLPAKKNQTQEETKVAASFLGPSNTLLNPPPKLNVNTRHGTGFFINAQGLMVTNWHVVENAKAIWITTKGQSKISAALLGSDARCDLAILKVSATPPNWLSLHRSVKKVRRGSEVMTVGFPQVNLQGQESKVTNGLISSLSGVADDAKFFQISVPIQPGNSGGPLVSREGLVVGVVTAKLSSKASAVSPENVNYAVKSDCVLDLLRSLPGKHRYDAMRSKKSKTGKKAKPNRQDKDLSMVDLTERVEKTVGLVTATLD